MLFWFMQTFKTFLYLCILISTSSCINYSGIEVTDIKAVPGRSHAQKGLNPQQRSIDDKVMLRLINNYRQNGATCGSQQMPAVAPLVWDYQLQEAAFDHALDMASNDYFSHTSLNGDTLSDRVDRTGFTWSSLGENLGRGQSNEQHLVESLMNSPGHCLNLMHASFTHVGVDQRNLYWVQVFARQ